MGNSNTILFGDNCHIGDNCSIRAEGNNIRITIGNNCTFSHDTEICAQEDGANIQIGEDCMLSHHINVRTSDSHLMYDVRTKEWLNPTLSVSLGNHVWIAPNSIIMKGVSIGEGSIIEGNTERCSQVFISSWNAS